MNRNPWNFFLGVNYLYSWPNC